MMESREMPRQLPLSNVCPFCEDGGDTSICEVCWKCYILKVSSLNLIVSFLLLNMNITADMLSWQQDLLCVIRIVANRISSRIGGSHKLALIAIILLNCKMPNMCPFNQHAKAITYPSSVLT